MTFTPKSALVSTPVWLTLVDFNVLHWSVLTESDLWHGYCNFIHFCIIFLTVWSFFFFYIYPIALYWEETSIVQIYVWFNDAVSDEKEKELTLRLCTKGGDSQESRNREALWEDCAWHAASITQGCCTSSPVIGKERMSLWISLCKPFKPHCLKVLPKLSLIRGERTALQSMGGYWKLAPTDARGLRVVWTREEWINSGPNLSGIKNKSQWIYTSEIQLCFVT